MCVCLCVCVTSNLLGDARIELVLICSKCCRDVLVTNSLTNTKNNIHLITWP